MFERRVVILVKASRGFAVEERSIGLMGGSATLPTTRGESSRLIGENRSSHHLNKLVLGGLFVGGPVGLTGGFVGLTVGLVRLFVGCLVVVGTCDEALVEDRIGFAVDGFAVKTVKVLGLNGCLVGRFTNGFRVVEWMFGCLGGRFTKGLRVVEWT